jgi:ABC-2 type transport system ATP-binding protein
MIQFSNVNKTYKTDLFKPKVIGVHDLSFEVSKGEIFGLIGPNGAGKSTTIKLMLGLLRPDSGEILFNGHSLGVTNFRCHVGYLPENPYLYDHLNLWELLRFCGKASGMSAERIAERGRLMMDRLGLTGSSRRPLRTFSKGMLQKAAVCFAVLHEPDMVILDEPMSGLDPIGRKLVFDLILELKEQGKTVFFCSHILSDVERLCDRVGFMAGGQLVRLISAPSAEERPIHLAVGSIAKEHRERLLPFAEFSVHEERESILSVAPSRLGALVKVLDELNIGILRTHDSRTILEDMFLDAIKGKS